MYRVHYAHAKGPLKYQDLGSQMAGGKSWRFIAMNLTTSHSDVRSSRDFLRQGPAFDAYGNKSVRHQQWKGDIVPLHVGSEGRYIPPDAKSTLLTVHEAVKLSSRVCCLVTEDNPAYRISVVKLSDTGVSAQVVTSASGPNETFALMSVTARLYTGSGGTRVSISYAGTSFVLRPNYDRYRALVQGIVMPSGPGSPAERQAFLQSRADQALYYAIGAAKQLCLDVRAGGVTAKGSSYRGTFTGEYPAFTPTSRIDAWLSHEEVECQHQWTSTELSDLGREVVEGVNEFGSNGIAYFKDLKDFGSSLRTLIGVAVAGPKPKDLASLWLSGRYGDRLTIADTKELLEAINRRISRGSGDTVSRKRIAATTTSIVEHYPITHERASTVIVRAKNPDALQDAVGSLIRWDVWPTLENMWDLVPLSFVVDWFVSVDRVLDQIDAAVEAPYLACRSQYVSDRWTMEVELPTEDLGVVGRLTLVRYHRRAENVLDHIKPFEALPFTPTFDVVHLGDAIALLAQRA